MTASRTGESITIVDYNPRWPLLFDEEKARILQAIGRWLVDVQQVGSTAVPGLAAKPIIDIMLGIRSLGDAKHCIPRMEALDYEYVPEFEDELPERRYFRKPGGPERKWQRDFHVHMVETTTDFWRRHLLFRDYLRAHPEAVREYAELKRQLAARFGCDREGYTDAKTEFIRSVEAKARQKAGQGARP